MARYGDLYTPASNYGKAYRGSLASRQKSIEQAGDNMVNFAGEIYNLVQKEREAKAEAQKNKMLEQEYLSQQNYRTSRIQQEKENQDFNRYQSQLRNLVNMHDTWIKQDDANMYKRWGGIDRTRKAYQQQIEQIEKALRNAETPEARMAVVRRYPQWFARFNGRKQSDIDALLDSYDIRELSGGVPFAYVTEEDYVNSMVSDDYKDDKGNIISKVNPYRDSLRAMLRHPKWGFADMVADVDKLKEEVEFSDNPKVKKTGATNFKQLANVDKEDTTANPNLNEKEAEQKDAGGSGFSTLLENKTKKQVDPEGDPVPIEETAGTAIQIAADLAEGDADSRREDARSARKYSGIASTIDTSPPDLSKEAQGEWSNAKDLLNDGGQKYLLINDPVTTFLVDNTLHSLGLPHALSKQGDLMYHSEGEMKDKATKAMAAWNNFKQVNKEFWKGPWDVTKIIPEFDTKSAPQAMQSITVMEGIEHSNPWLKDLPEDKKPLVGMIEEAMFEARPPGVGKVKYQPSLAAAATATAVMPWKRKFETPIVSAKDLIDRKMVQRRIKNFNDFEGMHKAMKEGRWKDAYTELVKSRIGETLLSTESGRNRLKVIEQMATGKAALTYTRPIQYLPELEDDRLEIKAEMEQYGGMLKDKDNNIIMNPMPGMVYDGQQAASEPVVESNEINIRERVLPADAVNMAWKQMTLATDNVTNIAEEDLPLQYKLMRMSQEKGDFGPNSDQRLRIRPYENIQSIINRNRLTP